MIPNRFLKSHIFDPEPLSLVNTTGPSRVAIWRAKCSPSVLSRSGDLAEKIMISSTVKVGANVVIFQPDLVNLYGCTVGDGTKLGAFVEVQSDASIGAHCKISSHSFICSGVTIEDGVFI